MKKSTYIKNGVEYENCIKCNKKTNIKFDFPIYFRRNFVQGSGQLCDDCYDETFKEGIKEVI